MTPTVQTFLKLELAGVTLPTLFHPPKRIFLFCRDRHCSGSQSGSASPRLPRRIGPYWARYANIRPAANGRAWRPSVAGVGVVRPSGLTTGTSVCCDISGEEPELTVGAPPPPVAAARSASHTSVSLELVETTRCTNWLETLFRRDLQ